MNPDQMVSSLANRSGSTVFPKKDKSWFSRIRVILPQKVGHAWIQKILSEEDQR